MSLSGILSVLSIKKGNKSRRKRSQDTSSEDGEGEHPEVAERQHTKERKGIFGSSAKQKQQESTAAGPSAGVKGGVSPLDDRIPWRKGRGDKKEGSKGKKGGYDERLLEIPCAITWD